MAHFYGTVKGKAGEASRLGTAKSGLRVVGTGWDVGVELVLEQMHPDPGNPYDLVSVTVTAGSNKPNTFGYFNVARGEADERPQIRFVHRDFFTLFTEQAWTQLFEDGQFLHMVRERLLPHLDKLPR